MRPFNSLENIEKFRHILKSSPSIYESSGIHFFKTTTGILLGPDTFDMSRLVMTFLTNLGVNMNILQFKLSPWRENRQRDIWVSSRFEFLEKFFAVWFYQKQKTTTQVRYIALVNRFTFAVNTISNLPKVIRA